MADMKDFIRPPFATYDIVVYFGGGLFSLPFLYRYILEPFKLHFPIFLNAIPGDAVNQVIRFLAIGFSVYILGHLLALFSAQLIEKVADRFLGNISSSIILSASTSNARRNQVVRMLIKQQISLIGRDNAILASVIRALAHLPLFPHYTMVYVFGFFGYYNTRIPKRAMWLAQKQYRTKLNLGDRISIRTKWYKPLEYFVINRYPDAVLRMYNYLIIAGLFRTISFIFLLSSWSVLYYLLHFKIDGEWALSGSFLGNGKLSGVLEFVTVSFLSIFCSVSYYKFQRRYAEEAIMAFIFHKP